GPVALQRDGLVSQLDVSGVSVGVGVNRDALDAQPFERLDGPDCDFATVGDKYGVKHDVPPLLRVLNVTAPTAMGSDVQRIIKPRGLTYKPLDATTVGQHDIANTQRRGHFGSKFTKSLGGHCPQFQRNLGAR